MQVPAMRVAFLPPTETAGAADGDQEKRLAIQAFPGPYTYPAMAEFLIMLAGALG